MRRSLVAAIFIAAVLAAGCRGASDFFSPGTVALCERAEQLAKQYPDVILSDLEMAARDCYDAARRDVKSGSTVDKIIERLIVELRKKLDAILAGHATRQAAVSDDRVQRIEALIKQAGAVR